MKLRVKSTNCDEDTAWGGYVDAGFQKEDTHSNLCVSSFSNGLSASQYCVRHGFCSVTYVYVRSYRKNRAFLVLLAPKPLFYNRYMYTPKHSVVSSQNNARQYKMLTCKRSNRAKSEAMKNEIASEKHELRRGHGLGGYVDASRKSSLILSHRNALQCSTCYLIFLRGRGST